MTQTKPTNKRLQPDQHVQPVNITPPQTDREYCYSLEVKGSKNHRIQIWKMGKKMAYIPQKYNGKEWVSYTYITYAADPDHPGRTIEKQEEVEFTGPSNTVSLSQAFKFFRERGVGKRPIDG